MTASAGSSRDPRWLYLHGFASGPQSSKAVALAEHYAARGITLERLDVRVPSLAELRVSLMIDHVRAAIGDAEDRAVIFGSSLGGYCAARVAERDPRVFALVLLAPAFRLLERWRARLGEEGFARWKAEDRLEVDDYVYKQKAYVDFGFVEDIEAIERTAGGPFPDVRVPTLILHGRGDDVVDIDASRTFARGKRHVTLVELDDGHELVASLPRIREESDDFTRWIARDH